jgi:hypothetical protein
VLDIVRAVNGGLSRHFSSGAWGCAMDFMMQFLVVLCVVLAVLWVREA